MIIKKIDVLQQMEHKLHMQTNVNKHEHMEHKLHEQNKCKQM